MKQKKDLTAAQVEKSADEWKSVSPETAKRLKRKVKQLIAKERAKKDASFTARLRRECSAPTITTQNFYKIPETFS
jgi:hypothetical protein